MQKIINIFFLALVIFGCNTSNSPLDNQTDHTNALINESSPYLLQHAHNPVNWYPWGQEALKKADKADKLIIISVGYAACHWCHVMEHESFEDTTVARIMNEHFVSIKVDREERPDVDNVYMTACQLLSDQGCGWPLNAIALPDGRPVWVGTYFPKKQWLGILEYFIKVYKDEKQQLRDFAAKVNDGIAEADQISPPGNTLAFERPVLDNFTNQLLDQIDPDNGGRHGAPKFPLPNQYQYLLYYYHLTKNQDALEKVLLSLDKMAYGGIYDHLGGGFARYATDEKWLVPHFEKMLYDNAQLVSLYSQAYQLTHKPLYKKVVEETLNFVERELADPNGGFYSSLDADSEGEEGRYYVWEKSAIDSILGPELSPVFCDYYDVSREGNWEDKNILNRKLDLETVARRYKMDITSLQARIETARKQLFEVRSKRVPPGLDDKILTAWNALMLQGYLDAYRALDNPKYLEKALKGAGFLEKNMIQEDNRLLRNHKDGKSVINAFLDDYAFTIQAFISLYQLTFDVKWLEKAKVLANYANQHFLDPSTNLYYYTSDLDPPLITRKIETTDNVIASSNSAMAIALYQLGTLLYQKTYKEQAENMLQTILPKLQSTEHPSYFTNWAQLYAGFAYPLFEVAIVGSEYASIHDELLSNYLPNALLLGGTDEGQLELLKGKLQEGETFVYVCRNNVCKLPVKTAEAALEQLITDY